MEHLNFFFSVSKQELQRYWCNVRIFEYYSNVWLDACIERNLQKRRQVVLPHTGTCSWKLLKERTEQKDSLLCWYIVFTSVLHNPRNTEHSFWGRNIEVRFFHPAFYTTLINLWLCVWAVNVVLLLKTDKTFTVFFTEKSFLTLNFSLAYSNQKQLIL